MSRRTAVTFLSRVDSVHNNGAGHAQEVGRLMDVDTAADEWFIYFTLQVAGEHINSRPTRIAAATTRRISLSWCYRSRVNLITSWLHVSKQINTQIIEGANVETIQDRGEPRHRQMNGYEFIQLVELLAGESQSQV